MSAITPKDADPLFGRWRLPFFVSAESRDDASISFPDESFARHRKRAMEDAFAKVCRRILGSRANEL
jgi:hypothetical protein